MYGQRTAARLPLVMYRATAAAKGSDAPVKLDPSNVSNDHEQTVYLVADDFGRAGLSFHEIPLDRTDLEAVITDLLTGRFTNPVRVVAFNTTERWASDVSEDIAREIQQRADLAYGRVLNYRGFCHAPR